MKPSNDELWQWVYEGSDSERLLAREVLNLQDALSTTSKALTKAENVTNITTLVPVAKRTDVSKLRYLADKLDAANERLDGEAHNPGAYDITGVAFALRMMAVEVEAASG